jgi:hypothetical protein
MLRPALELARNLSAGARLALFLPVTRWQFRPGMLQLALLLGISLSLNLVYDLYLVWPGARFSFPGLYYQSLLYLLFFASVIVLTHAGREPAAALPLSVLILAIAPTTFLVYVGALLGVERLIANESSHLYSWLTVGYLAWYLLIVLRAIRLVLEPRAVACAGMLATFAAFNIVPWYYLLPPEPLWTEVETVRQKEGFPDLERLFFQQDELIARGTRGLIDQRPGVMDIYFVGVAGDAAEDVFMNEVQKAARVFSDDFEAAGRSLLLVNNPATFDRLPLANRDNLSAALDGVSLRMDPEEDMLVLFLSSHGEEHEGLVLSLDGFRLGSISPRLLRAALDGAGIRFRAVIVSACFSGAFLDELRDDATLVMTSARSDRSSFGCGHDGAFTYFGAAFIGTELPKDLSFVAAFERARATLAEREREEGLTPSEPQLWVGSEIGPRLEQVSARLRARGMPQAPDAAPQEGTAYMPLARREKLKVKT